MGPVSALSHLTLAAPNASLHEKTRKFYADLGFKVISTDPKSDDVWLHLYPPTANVKNATGVTIRLITDADVSFDVEKVRLKTEKLSTAPIDLKNAWGCFVLKDLQKTRNTLENRAIPFQAVGRQLWGISGDGADSVPSEDAPSAIVTYDPLGNLVTFTNRVSPFGNEEIPQSDDINTRSYSTAVDAIADGTPLKPKEERKKRIGVLTSGGDSSGMNAAVRSITRMALQRGCLPFAIYEGYQGLVEGGRYIRQLGWEDVRGLLAVGGTSIGTARCAEFRTREGRLRAVHNLITRGIDALIVIGGDGSLTGADLLRSEWTGLVDELIASERVSAAACEHVRDQLTIVGLVGSIDNDMALTDITIGAVTSLHRICEAVDNLTSTALSHQRAFVIEVMGRHCGWLGLMAAISVGADCVFLPERPPPLDVSKYGDDWESEMCDTIDKYRHIGNRKSLVIVCEGAIDRQLRPIKADYVQKILTDRLHLDTRVTQLGHVQRGGTPCAFDRFLATVQGVDAVEAVLSAKRDSPALMIGISHNKITAVPLMEAVQQTKSVAVAIERRDFEGAMELRDPEFTGTFDAFIESTIYGDHHQRVPAGEKLRVGIVHTGAPAGGMNAATRIAARLCLNRGHVPVAVRNGWSGLVRDEVTELCWGDTIGWQVRGGSELGTNRDHPAPLPDGPKIDPRGEAKFVDLGLIAYHLQKHDINALLLIGGFEAYTSQLVLTHARDVFPAFCIPMVQLPATVSNNVPGTDYSIGSDTALNVIVAACDSIKLSANASRKRVFVVEVQGGNCGYLATLGGLAVGAMNVYIPEKGVHLGKLQRDINHMNRRYNEEDRAGIPNEGRILLRSEMASSTYTTETVSKIIRAESRGLYDSRTAVLGHLQQGGVPSPLDRIRATRLAVNCVGFLQKSAQEARERMTHHGMVGAPGVYTKDPKHSCIVGIIGAEVAYTPVTEVLKTTELKARRSKEEWWMNITRLIRVLSKYEFAEELDDASHIDLLRKRDPSHRFKDDE